MARWPASGRSTQPLGPFCGLLRRQVAVPDYPGDLNGEAVDT